RSYGDWSSDVCSSDLAMLALLTGGHCLIEGVPGLAKTLTVSTLARVVGGEFTRIQFTPDLVPADIVGTRIWRPSHEQFDIEWGQIGRASCRERGEVSV